MRPARPTGFTLIEVLVSIAVISLLLGLAIPATQAAREASRRARCANNLRQIGLAVQGYAADCGVFPPVDLFTRRYPNGVWFSAHEHSAFARILPYLEQGRLFDSINFEGIPTADQPLWDNDTAMEVDVAAFLCPSDSGTPVRGYGRTNYRVNHGPTFMYSPNLNDPTDMSGPFCVHFVYRPADFRDGLSATVGISERLQGDWSKATYQANGDYLLGPWTTPPVRDADGALMACSLLSRSGPHESRGGESWFLSGFHFTGYNHVATPNWNGPACAFDTAREDIHNRTMHPGVFPASSAHPHGVSTVFMDGSVRFVKDSVNIQAWRAASTRSGGEAIGDDAL